MTSDAIIVTQLIKFFSECRKLINAGRQLKRSVSWFITTFSTQNIIMSVGFSYKIYFVIITAALHHTQNYPTIDLPNS